jgi:hypothetical protein
MWKMLPLVNSEEEGEEFFAKWVDCQKGEKIAKINPTKKRKKLPKRRFISFFTTNIPSKHNPYISVRVIKQHEEEEEEEEEERERERENKRESLRRICRDITANTATRTSRTIPRPFEDNTFPDLNTKRT